jgi:predicted Zn-dependent protease with MMP-like domain
MKKDAFTTWVAEALDELPALFRKKMENVEIIVEDFADRETLDALGIQSRWMILGLYSGVPLPHQSFFNATLMPHRIYLYRRPILRAAGSSHNVVQVIRDVLVHEVGHHFGFDDDQLERLQLESDNPDGG